MTGLRRYQIVIPLLLLFLLLSACRQEQKTERTSIVLLHGYGSNSERDRVMREIYKEFELQHPHISLHLVSVPSFDKVEAKTRDMLAVGKMPNIIYTGGYTTDRFYRFMLEQGYLTDLLPHIRKDADFHANLSPKIWQDWGEGEALYTVTDHLSVRGYWYNRKIFTNAGIVKAPESKAEFYAACEKINVWAAENKYDTVPLALHTEEAADLLQYLMGASASDAIPVFPLGENEENFKAALEELKILSAFKKENREYGKKDSLQSFTVGHSAIYIGEQWEGILFPDTLDAEFRFFVDEEGILPMYSALSGFLLSNLSDEKQKEAGILLIRYMLSDKVQRKLAVLGFVPANPAVFAEESSVLSSARRQELQSATRTVQAPEKVWKGLHYAVFSSHIQTYLQGDLSLEDFVRYMQEEKLQ